MCTAEHPFYVVGKGFVPAKALTTKDNLVLSDNSKVGIDKLEIEKLAAPETTYNFEVADFHTYYVSEKSILVHNKCSIDIDIEPELGNKLEYAFGNAKGSSHNIRRSMDNAAQLGRIGIHDNAAGRQILSSHLNNVFYSNQAEIMSTSSRMAVNSLLAGPGGFLGVHSVWEKNKLITFIFIGG